MRHKSGAAQAVCVRRRTDCALQHDYAAGTRCAPAQIDAVGPALGDPLGDPLGDLMRKPTSVAAAAALTLSALLVSAAFAQTRGASPDQGARDRPPFGLYAQAGAGGPAGAGAGPAYDRQSVGDGARCTPAASRPLVGIAAPVLDPQRNIYAVDCTRPIDPLGRGNLCCL